MEKQFKVIIALEMTGDFKNNPEATKEAVYSYLQELIDDNSLDFEIEGVYHA